MASRSKKKQLKHKDVLADKGLAFKKKKGITLSTFTLIKVLLLIALPLAYFLYSKALLVVAVGFIITFVLSFKAENTENVSVIKSNRISILRFDSAIALILICVTIFGICSSLITASKNSALRDFATSSSDDSDDERIQRMQTRMFWRGVSRNVTTLFTLSTGERNILVFFSGGDYSFSGSNVKPSRPQGGGGSSNGEGSGERPSRPMRPEMSDLPIEYLSDTIFSSVCAGLIALMFVAGTMSIHLVYDKKRKIASELKRVAIDYKGSSVTEEELTRLLEWEG